MKKAVIRSDIKTGIKVAGFMDFITKEFDEIMTIQNNQDMAVLCSDSYCHYICDYIINHY